MTQGTCGTVYRTNVRAPMFFLFFLRLGFLIIINPEIPLFNRDLYIGVSHIRYLGIGVHPCLSILDIQPYLFFAQKKNQRNCQTVCFFCGVFVGETCFFGNMQPMMLQFGDMEDFCGSKRCCNSEDHQKGIFKRIPDTQCNSMYGIICLTLGGGFKYLLFLPRTLGKMNPF